MVYLDFVHPRLIYWPFWESAFVRYRLIGCLSLDKTLGKTNHGVMRVTQLEPLEVYAGVIAPQTSQQYVYGKSFAFGQSVKVWGTCSYGSW